MKNRFGNQSLICIIILIILCYLGAASIAMAVYKNSIGPEHRIYFLPMGDIEDGVLEILKNRLAKTFECDVEIRGTMIIPPKAYNPRRKQYFSSRILDELHTIITPSEQERFLAITGVDLYVPQLNFVFGEAEIGGHFAIISLARLHQSFYGLPEDRAIFLERAVKEAVHELGHAFGLRHCPDPECVMHFSNSLLDTDRKKAVFCSSCQKHLEKRKFSRKNTQI